MGLLERISSPRDVRRLTTRQVDDLAAEIRAFLVDSVSRTGGHLGPNLGVVELSIALHRVFDSPRDTIVFDTGHQAYVHKLLTGRQDFTALRRGDGLSGYPARAESEHDVVENSHASTALSWADGIAKARQLRGEAGAGPIDWIVLRNRLGSQAMHNKRKVGTALTQLSKRIGFRVAPGFAERVIFRELFPRGLTLLDLKDIGTEQLSMSNIAARQELRELITTLNLPGVSVSF